MNECIPECLREALKARLEQARAAARAECERAALVCRLAWASLRAAVYRDLFALLGDLGDALISERLPLAAPANFGPEDYRFEFYAFDAGGPESEDGPYVVCQFQRVGSTWGLVSPANPSCPVLDLPGGPEGGPYPWFARRANRELRAAPDLAGALAWALSVPGREPWDDLTEGEP